MRWRASRPPVKRDPSGDFATAADAMASAVARLRALPRWETWITFSAQGEGHRPDSYQFHEVRLLGNLLDAGAAEIDLPALTRAAGVPSTVVRRPDGLYDLSAPKPRQVAGVLDAVFRIHHHLRPFPEHEGDYAVGAEW